MPPFAVALYHLDRDGHPIVHAMPVMLAVLVVLALAYRFYSKFLAAKVAALDDSRATPAVRLADGQNYHPTNKWVAFGHHFAAISGAGPLIGPVLAIQYGYLPGLLWLVIGVCLAGAVQDMLVLAASVRTDGKSLAEIARRELGRPAAAVASVAILVIIVIALAGLGFVVVKALGGEEAKLPAGTRITLPMKSADSPFYRHAVDVYTHEAGPGPADFGAYMVHFPAGCQVAYPGSLPTHRSEAFRVRMPLAGRAELDAKGWSMILRDGHPDVLVGVIESNWPLGTLSPNPAQRQLETDEFWTMPLPTGCTQVVPGSSWGTFTIAATIPIAIFVGVIMRYWKSFGVVAGSLVGGGLTLAAVVVGGSIPGSALEPYFSLTRGQTVLALTGYGFVAAVLPVWLLLGPRDYLSSFLKIGTVILLVGSVMVANPPLAAPPLNETFVNGGPTFKGHLFPFVFICVMCGAVSGFHALVSSGTTPKMIEKESQIRTIGYGAMLIESLVGVTALIAAASLPTDLYYDINVAIDDSANPALQAQLKEVREKYGNDRLHAVGVENVGHLNLGEVEQKVGGESLRGRTGGAVTLAVGMAVVFEDAFKWVGVNGEGLLKYWYHFAIMFEALFILTTIDAGTRIGRFLLQESLGRVIPAFARTDWLPGALLASAVITGGWGALIYTGSIDTIWPMFGVANQLLAVLALALVTTWLVNHGRGRYAWVTILPMLWVCTTTLTAGTQLVTVRFPALMNTGRPVAGALNMGLTIFVMCAVGALVLTAAARWVAVWTGRVKVNE